MRTQPGPVSRGIVEQNSTSSYGYFACMDFRSAAYIPVSPCIVPPPLLMLIFLGKVVICVWELFLFSNSHVCVQLTFN